MLLGVVGFLLVALIPPIAIASPDGAAPVVVSDSIPNLLKPDQTISGGCTAMYLGDDIFSGNVTMNPVYEQVKYQCEPGYFLGAGKTECEICSENHYCAGGTFTYSESESAGIESCPDDKNSVAGAKDASECTFPSVPCDAGYYLAANKNECDLCTDDHYCPGGTFALSDTDAGLENCPEGLVSGRGAGSVGECGVILYVDNKPIYLTQEQMTTPALAVDIRGTVYYGRMTPVSEESTDTTPSFIINAENQQYVVHDGIIKGEQ